MQEWPCHSLEEKFADPNRSAPICLMKRVRNYYNTEVKKNPELMDQKAIAEKAKSKCDNKFLSL